MNVRVHPGVVRLADLVAEYHRCQGRSELAGMLAAQATVPDSETRRALLEMVGEFDGAAARIAQQIRELNAALAAKDK